MLKVFFKVVVALLALLGLLVLVLALNTWRQSSRQVDVPPLAPLAVDEDGAAQRLSEAIRARTLSALDNPERNAEQFRQLHLLLQQNYPRAHAVLTREVINEQSLLYTWLGSDAQAKPILLLAHQDVVPVAPGTEPMWSEAPFDGVVKDGYVWGRGAWDNKGNLIAQMEAVEMLVASGFKPKRTIYLAFGADEEVGGLRGAKKIAELLKQRNVKLDFIIDEGLLITEGVLPGLKPAAAIIGIAEKGYVSLDLSVTAPPGHSSIPPAKGTGAIAVMSAALKQLDDRQLPAHIRGVAREMFQTVAPEMSGFSRVALSNLWLFGSVVQKQLEAGASTNAMLRTTTALTIVNAGNRDNVLPGLATATVNYRLLPGDSQATVLEHAKQVIGNEKVTLKVRVASEPSKVAPTDSASYKLIERTVRELFPGTIVAPGLMVGGTDSKHFEDICDHIYKFSPVRAKPEDLARFHGTNERIATANLAELIRFYHRLLSQGAARASDT